MYEIYRTDSFMNDLKDQKKNTQLLNELDKKIQKLKTEPHNIGKHLSGNLKGKKSVRLARNFRLIFEIDEKGKRVYLEALDNRTHIYR